MTRRLVKQRDLEEDDMHKDPLRVATSPGSSPTVVKKRKVDGSFSGVTKPDSVLSFGIPPDQIRQSRESSNLLEPRNAAKLHHAACQLPTGLPALSAPLEHHMQQSSRQSSENPSDAEENEERQDDRANDPACIQCDDGGSIMFCDGPCMRAFHCGVEVTTSRDDGDCDSADESLSDFHCNPLGMPRDLYLKLKDTKDILHCPNCLVGVHQCFGCKEEGVIDYNSKDAKNFQFATKLVFSPLHTCETCGGSQSNLKDKGALIPCRRCPRAYHERCLPFGLLTLPSPKRPKTWKQRVWIAACDGNAVAEVDRSLVYCMKHSIADDDHTPCHKRPVFHPGLVQRWHEAYADKFPELASSTGLARKANILGIPLAQRKRLTKAPVSPSAMAGVPPPIASKKPPVAKAPIVQASIEDIPLAQRKRAKPPVSPFATAGAKDVNKQFASSAPQGRVLHESAQHMSVTGAMTAQASDTQVQATAVRNMAAVSSISVDASAKVAAYAKAAAQPTDTVKGARGSSPIKGRALHRSGSNTASSDTSKRQLKDSNAGAQSAGLGKSDLLRLHSDKNRASDAARPVKGLPALSRSLSKKGSSTSQGGVVRNAVSLFSKDQGAKALGVLPMKAKVDTSKLVSKTSGLSRTAEAGPVNTAKIHSKRVEEPAVAAKAVSRHKEEAVHTQPKKAKHQAAREEQHNIAERGTPLQPPPLPPLPEDPPLPDNSASDELPPLPEEPAPSADALPLLGSGSDPPPVPNRIPTHAKDKVNGRALAQSKPPSTGPKQRSDAPSLKRKRLCDDGRHEAHAVPKQPPADAHRHRQFQGTQSNPIPHGVSGNLEATGFARQESPPPPPPPTALLPPIDPHHLTPPPPPIALPPYIPPPPPPGNPVFQVTGDVSRLWKKVQERITQRKTMSLCEREEEAIGVVEAVLAQSKAKITLSQVKRTTRQPEPYNKPCLNTTEEARLKAYEEAVVNATENPEMAHLLVSFRIAKEVVMHEDDFMMALAPYMHANRYSSYGRHFTKTDKLTDTARLLCRYLVNGDTVVDFSCGANAFVPIVRYVASHEHGKVVKGRAYDIITAHRLDDFVRQSWLDVRPGSLPHGDELVIGLNPPFGKNNTLAQAFVEHAARFRPSIIILIVPPRTPIPIGYNVDYEDVQTMAHRAFFVPGTDKDSWNKEAPALRVLVRSDCPHRAYSAKLKHAQGIGPMSHMMLPHQHMHPGHLDPRLHQMQRTGLVSGPQHLQAGYPAAPIREPWGLGHPGHPGPDQMPLPSLPPPPHAQHGRFR